MKFLFFFLFLFALPSTDKVVEWISPVEHDFGDLQQNSPATHKFKFKNTTDEPLIIENVRSTCGCTGVDWEDDVIAPGEEGVIKIEFDTKKLGFFYKKINVFFNAQRKPEKLAITGYVE